MDKKRRLLDALAHLEMPFEKKQDFVNLLLENTNKDKENYVYFDTSSITEIGREELDVLYSVSCILKENTEEGGVGIFNTGYRYGQFPPLAIGVDLNMRISNSAVDGMLTDEFITIEEKLVDDGISWVLDLPRITEEEFYKLPTQFMVENGGVAFEPTTYFYDEGMTWREWCDSEYNTLGYTISSNGKKVIGVVPEYGYKYAIKYDTSDGSYYVHPDDLIESKSYYMEVTE